MITPKSEWYFRSGLAKSAFKESIYRGLPLDFFIPGIERTYRLASLRRVRPKFYQTHDVFLAFYVPFKNAYASLKEKNRASPAWRAFMEGFLMRTEYVKLNQLTQWSLELAAAAAASVLARIGSVEVPPVNKEVTIDELNEAARSLAGGAVPPGLEEAAEKAGGAQALLKNLEKAAKEWGKAVAHVAEDVARELEAFAEARQEAEAAAAVLAGGQGYALEGLSVWHFLKDPDEFRRRVALLTSAASAFRRFTQVLPASLEQVVETSMWGGIDGVARMRYMQQLTDALPSELALASVSRVLFAVKIAQMSLTVYRRAAAAKYVLFLDKSGSMADELEPGSPKISLAAGLALALHRRMRNVELYLFDTEVDRVSPREVVSTLLRIRADGGTNIGRVMEEALRIDKPDSRYIIISDGITDADRETARRFIERCGSRAKLILVPPSRDGYGWIQALKRLGNVAYAHDVAKFEDAARRILR
jgi:uncharacterized protein with von Willebrand factor type A (vWA) domain